MARYSVEASAAHGRSREQLIIEADSEANAARLVLAQGRFPITVRAERSGWASRLNRSVDSVNRIGLTELALFAEQLADLVRAGVTIEQALDLLSPSSRGRVGGIAKDESDRRDRVVGMLAERLLRRVREGDSFSAALRQETAVPSSFAGVIQGAEGAGALAVGLSSLAISLQRQGETRERIRSALAYPVIVLVVAVLAVVFVLTAVIPEFAPLFAGEEARLPLVTRAVLWLSGLLTGRLLLAGSMIAFISLAGRLIWRYSNGIRHGCRKLALRLPPVRYALRLDLAQATRVMGALLESGMEASRAMQLAGEAASFDRNRNGFSDAARNLREGESLSRAYAGLPQVPEAAVSLLLVGERGGQAGAAASRAAQLIETDTNRRVNRLLATLNPVAVITLGALVALFIAAVMLGILSINQLALR